ncbi:MAG: aminoacyl-tRNA hydrolase [Vicinamibacteria bacterium]|nr:aminoacyl-tRNA hydrolase [Vicinamibacteria bacterium]
MRLIVGLGNPGEKYRRTRHNAGFMVVDELAQRLILGARERIDDAWAAKTEIAGERVVLLKPQAFMNRSGPVVEAALRWFNVEPESLVVVSDDVALPLGTLRIRARGSHGGQNGLRSIIESIGSEEFVRLRFGIGSSEPAVDLAGFVLSDFDDGDVLRVQEMVSRAADAVFTIVEHGVELAMNTFNAAKAQPE